MGFEEKKVYDYAHSEEKVWVGDWNLLAANVFVTFHFIPMTDPNACIGTHVRPNPIIQTKTHPIPSCMPLPIFGYINTSPLY